jgi:hypothetical protein
MTSPSTVGGDQGKRRSAQRFPPLPTRKWSPQQHGSLWGFPKATSASLGLPTQPQSRRSAAMDRQVGERPVDRHHRPDRPLGQVGEDHRGERVNVAVEGQLAPAGDDHHQHVDLVVAVRLDAVAPAEPDEVGLQVLPVEPPQSPLAVSARREAGQVDWRDGVAHAAMFASPASATTVGVRGCDGSWSS